MRLPGLGRQLVCCFFGICLFWALVLDLVPLQWACLTATAHSIRTPPNGSEAEQPVLNTARRIEDWSS